MYVQFNIPDFILIFVPNIGGGITFDCCLWALLGPEGGRAQILDIPKDTQKLGWMSDLAGCLTQLDVPWLDVRKGFHISSITNSHILQEHDKWKTDISAKKPVTQCAREMVNIFKILPHCLH